ncbi:4a-hydroxytetrahydrobiopterin dehydratase [Aurantibacter sp.]|uniref:4a-hydroxytetrahydrobiopterin dehydratase n=1 Tax=Aurantibacter sp. TaxID=2807103 RepID=UPI0035C82533
MKTLTEKEINEKLKALPEWDYVDNTLYCEFEFNNFKDCFSAMSRMAFECEAQNHHPDWSNTYNLLTVSLTTHDANGVTQKDFDLAHAFESIVEEE